MPGKYTQGFTKNAQKQKYVRHRDMKMKDSELRKEDHIQQVMVEGICRKCREKIQWRFNFDKYKPLRAPATCQQCKQKTITRAYRTLCDGCGQAKNACPACCGDMTMLAAQYAIDNAANQVTKAPAEEEASPAPAAVSTSEEVREELSVAVEEVVMEMDGGEEEDDEEEGEGSEDEDSEEMEADQGDEEDMEDLAAQEAALDEGAVPSAGASGILWDEKKFRNVSANKYSKQRPTGREA